MQLKEYESAAKLITKKVQQSTKLPIKIFIEEELSPAVFDRVKAELGDLGYEVIAGVEQLTNYRSETYTVPILIIS